VMCASESVSAVMLHLSDKALKSEGATKIP
jgi:hypothetical protein